MLPSIVKVITHKCCNYKRFFFFHWDKAGLQSAGPPSVFLTMEKGHKSHTHTHTPEKNTARSNADLERERETDSCEWGGEERERFHVAHQWGEKEGRLWKRMETLPRWPSSMTSVELLQRWHTDNSRSWFQYFFTHSKTGLYAQRVCLSCNVEQWKEWTWQKGFAQLVTDVRSSSRRSVTMWDVLKGGKNVSDDVSASWESKKDQRQLIILSYWDEICVFLLVQIMSWIEYTVRNVCRF